VQLQDATISPSTKGETAYFVTVFARNKATYETLRVRFNAQSQKWEASWHVEREEKRPHYSGKTKMAEGEVRRIMEDHSWSSNAITPINPATQTVVH
jgi:hypothetical protein